MVALQCDNFALSIFEVMISYFGESSKL